MRIRPTREDDLPAILAIYNRAILTSTATYDIAPQTLEMRREWFTAKEAAGWPMLTAEVERAVAGFGSYGPFRPQQAYCHTVEHSLYVAEAYRGRGVGRQLLGALIGAAVSREVHVMIAGIDADNTISLALHRRCGFEEVAHFREVGRKFDRWLDVIFMQRIIRQR